MTFLHLRSARRVLCVAATLCLSSPSWGQAMEASFADMARKTVSVPKGEPGSELQAHAAQAIGHLKKMDLPEASRAINEALQLDARNSYLHFLNGFVYHLQSRQGDTQKSEMAVEGYQQALRMDPGNWIAQEFLGLAQLDLKHYPQAKQQFSEALLLAPDSTVSLYGLMVSSYMSGDPVLACAMADQFRQASTAPHAGFARSGIAVYASCGQFDKADAMRAAYGQVPRERGDLEGLDRRLNQWKATYTARAATAQAARTDTMAALIQESIDRPPGAGDAADLQAALPDAAPAMAPVPMAPVPDANDGTPRMVLVDVVLVSTQELVTTAKGINLLNALTLQLGSASQAAFSRSYNGATPDAGTVITRALTVPALSYSLNIANANNTLNEVLARPTLAAMEGLPSEFFAGTNLNAAVVQTSSLGVSSAVPVDKRFGVKLAVTPAFLPNGMVKLKVDAQRTFLNANVDSAGFAYRLEISETTANANVVMKLGDTLVLSGLSEKEASSSRTGVPLLQDVPGVQYLFSTKRTSDYQHSVLILITPRTPLYTGRADGGGASGSTESMKALREKFGFSARTPANVESVMNHLKTTNLFRDFRQGDVSMERWDRMHSTGDRLRQAMEFLYY